MSNNLDKKLEEVLLPYDLSRDGLPGFGDLRESSEKLIEQIKQAFIDDGWRWLPREKSIDELVEMGLAEKCLTKEEWERQAVKDGWVKPDDRYVGPDTHIIDPNYTNEQLKAISKEWSRPRMTGQEWYERFQKEFEVIGWPRKTEVTINIQSVLDAAKKAAGIE